MTDLRTPGSPEQAYAKLFALAVRVLHEAFYADEDASQCIDWDLVSIAHESILDLARKGLAAEGDS